MPIYRWQQGEAGVRRLREAEEIMAHAIELLVPSLGG